MDTFEKMLRNELSPAESAAMQGIFIENDRDGGLIAAKAPFIIQVSKSRVVVTDTRTGDVEDRQVQTFGGERYKDFEGFIRSCDGGARVSWYNTHDMDVVFIYDNRPAQESNDPDEDGTGGNFGYAFNVNADWCSEWGYASMFPAAGETIDQMNARRKDEYDVMMNVFSDGGAREVFVIDDEAPMYIRP